MALLFVTTNVAAEDDATVLARGRELSVAFLAGDTASVYAQMEPGMQRFVRGAENFAKFGAGARKELGDEIALVAEQVSSGSGVTTYERIARFAAVTEPYALRIDLDADGKVAGFAVMPYRLREPAPSRRLDYVTQASLRLPFDGDWSVGWGGRTVEQNVHALHPQQRFAYDLLVMRDGRTHRGDGARVEDYYCWDAPILAPAAGTVVNAVGDLPDQKPGEMDKKNLPGNHVTIDLGNAEYAVLGHLRQGSVRVDAGDTVRAGEEIGRCGNSGNTSEPHLHFHLQSAPRLEEGEGLPALFVDYVADGAPVARGEPIKGQVVRQR